MCVCVCVFACSTVSCCGFCALLLTFFLFIFHHSCFWSRLCFFHASVAYFLVSVSLPLAINSLLLVVPTCMICSCSVVVSYSQIFMGALLLTYLLLCSVVYFSVSCSPMMFVDSCWWWLFQVLSLSLSLSVTYPSCVCSVCSVTCLPAKRRVYILSKSASTHVSVTQENTWSVCDLCYLSSSKWNWMHLCQP